MPDARKERHHVPMTQAISPFEAIAVVEISSIARGYVVLDAIAKRARVTVRYARPVSPGKFVILFGGEVACVQESFEAARELAQGQLLDELILAQAHPQLLPAVDGTLDPAQGESVGIVEMHSVASAVEAADIALKACEVSVARMQLAIGIGGKGYFVLAGPLADMEAALETVRERVHEEQLIAIELISNPHDEVRGFLS